jgi:hypothetical protein
MCLIGLSLLNYKKEIKVKTLKINYFLFNTETDENLFNHHSDSCRNLLIINDVLFNLNPEINTLPIRTIQ